MGAASETEKRLSMLLFYAIFDSLSSKPYDPEFVAMIKESEQQIKKGKTVKYEPGTNLWDLVNSK